MSSRKTTTEQGLGHRHQQAVVYLRSIHKDGSPCEWCGRPMWLDATKNFDYDRTDPKRRGNGVLQGDHSKMSRKECLRRGIPIPPPDRLLHAVCNNMRGEGLHDDLSPVNIQKNAEKPKLAMDWPWSE